jgi:hypothetical protein
MLSIFDTNDALKKNVPKNIQIINYLPIFFLNYLWLEIVKDKVNDLKTVDNKLEEYSTIKNTYLFSNNNVFNDTKILEIVNKTNKYLEKKKKYMEEKKDYFKNINKGQSSMYETKETLYSTNVTDITIENTILFSLFSASSKDNIFDILSEINIVLDHTKLKLYNNKKSELTHHILGSLIKYYCKDNPVNRTENVHLVISRLYSEILFDIKTVLDEINSTSEGKEYEIIGNKFRLKAKKTYKDLEQYKLKLNILKDLLKEISTYLNTRFDEKNLVIDNIHKSITYTSMIILQNSFLLSIKRLVVKHTIKVYGIDQIENKWNSLREKLMKVLFNDAINMGTSTKENITESYVKEVLDYKVTKDVEYNGFDNIISGIKEILSNELLNNTVVLENYENYLVPYYRSLYKEMVEHLKKLVFNYIKFVMNQYEGLCIFLAIIDKVVS